MGINGAGGRPSGLPKTGGRQKGTPNKATLTAAEKIEALGCDPLAGMAGLAMNEKNPPELRARLFIELAQYIYPKRKAVDTAVEKASVTNFITKLDPGSSDDSNQPDPGA
jgi:hypothetical protein